MGYAWRGQDPEPDLGEGKQKLGCLHVHALLGNRDKICPSKCVASSAFSAFGGDLGGATGCVGQGGVLPQRARPSILGINGKKEGSDKHSWGKAKVQTFVKSLSSSRCMHACMQTGTHDERAEEKKGKKKKKEKKINGPGNRSVGRSVESGGEGCDE